MAARCCRYHCRECGGHLTSLAAFDAHEPRSRTRSGCVWPDDAPLREIPGGECRIGYAEPVVNVTLYEHARDAERLRTRRRADEAPSLDLYEGRHRAEQDRAGRAYHLHGPSGDERVNEGRGYDD